MWTPVECMASNGLPGMDALQLPSRPRGSPPSLQSSARRAVSPCSTLRINSLPDEKLLGLPFADSSGAKVPTRFVIHRNPPALLFPVMPIFVHLVKHLPANDLENVANFVVVII